MSDHREIIYDPSTDTMYVEIRPGPTVGGEDAGEDLVIHFGEDDQPSGWEIEHASEHPEHVVAALRALRAARGHVRAAA